MNPTETTEMLEIIRRLKGQFTIVLIEHKLDLVMQLSDRVVVMDDGRKIAEAQRARLQPTPQSSPPISAPAKSAPRRAPLRPCRGPNQPPTPSPSLLLRP